MCVRVNECMSVYESAIASKKNLQNNFLVLHMHAYAKALYTCAKCESDLAHIL